MQFKNKLLISVVFSILISMFNINIIKAEENSKNAEIIYSSGIQSFNLPNEKSEKIFPITINEDNSMVSVDLFSDSGKFDASIAFALYSSNAFSSETLIGQVGFDLFARETTIENTTEPFTIKKKGTYYLRIVNSMYINNIYYKDVNVTPIKFKYQVYKGDEFEDNDTMNKAVPLNKDEPIEFTLLGNSDEDWFEFTVTDPGIPLVLEFSCEKSSYDSPFSLGIYDSSGTRVTDVGISNYASNAIKYPDVFTYTFENSGNYYIRLNNAVFWNPYYYDGDNKTAIKMTSNFGKCDITFDTVGRVKSDKNKYNTVVIDDKFRFLSGAEVRIGDNFVKTDENGYAALSIGESDLNQRKEVFINKKGYEKLSEFKLIEKGKLDIFVLYPDDGKAKVTSATLTSNSGNHSLTSDYFYLSENENGYKIDDKNITSVNWGLEIKSNLPDLVYEYQLIQGAEVKMSSKNGKFNLPIFTKKDNIEFVRPITNTFKAGEKVVVRLIDENRKEIATKELTLAIYKEDIVQDFFKDAKFKLTDGFSISRDELGAFSSCFNKLNLSFGDNSPISFEVGSSSDGKISLKINKNNEASDKDFIKKIRNQAKTTKGLLNKKVLGAGEVDMDIDFGVYAEGYIKDDNINLNGDIYLDGETSYTYEKYSIFPTNLGPLPTFIELKGKAGVELKKKAALNFYKGTKDLYIEGGIIKSNIGITASPGVGINGLLSGAISGELNLEHNYEMDSKYTNLLLDADLGGKLCGGGTCASLNFAESSYVLYQSYIKQKSLEASMLENNKLLSNSKAANKMYNIDWNVNFNAQPQVINFKNRYYSFYIKDILDRDNQDASALVYSISDDGENWSDPIILSDDGTLDESFSILESDDNIKVVWTNGVKNLNNIGDNEHNKIEVRYAEFDTEKSILKNEKVISETNRYKYKPKIISKDNQIFITWIENVSNSVDEINSNNDVMFYDGNNLRTLVTINNSIHNYDIGLLKDDFVCAVSENIISEENIKNRLTLIDEQGLQRKVDLKKDVVLNPQFGKLSGMNSLIWYSLGNYSYINDLNDIPKTLLDSDTDLASGYFKLESNSEISKIIMLNRDDNTYFRFDAIRIDENGVSNIYELFKTNSNYTVTGFDCYVEDKDQMKFYYSEAYKDLNSAQLKYADYKDEKSAEIINVEYDDSQVIPNGKMDFIVTIRNTSPFDITSFNLQIENNNYTFDNVLLKSGSETKIEVKDYSVPEIKNYTKELKFNVKLDSKTSENYYIEIGYDDYSLDYEKVTIGDRRYLLIYLDSKYDLNYTGTLNIYDSADYENVIYSRKYKSLKSDETISLMIDLEELPNGDKLNELFIKMIPNHFSDLDVSNNESYVVLTEDGQLYNKLNLGDVDGNNKINALDALLIVKFASGNIIESFIEQNADVNKDGKINSLDALIVLKYSSGQITEF